MARREHEQKRDFLRLEEKPLGPKCALSNCEQGFVTVVPPGRVFATLSCHEFSPQR
jgi:hypothetical protein